MQDPQTGRFSSCISCSCEPSALLVQKHIGPPAFCTRLRGLEWMGGRAD